MCCACVVVLAQCASLCLLHVLCQMWSLCFMRNMGSVVSGVSPATVCWVDIHFEFCVCVCVWVGECIVQACPCVYVCVGCLCAVVRGVCSV